MGIEQVTMERMKKAIFVILIVMVIFGCSHRPIIDATSDTHDTIQVPEGITGEDSVAYMENMVYQSPISVEAFLSLAEVHSIEEKLIFYNNYELAEKYPEIADGFIADHYDSCALRLANRFMRMHHLAYENGDAMDMLQWAEAVNAVLDTFHVEMPEVDRDSLLSEIERVINKFSSLSQSEMNLMCYVDASIEYYLTIESYRQLLNEVPEILKPLFQEEYKTWFQLNEARYAFWRDVSYSQEWYSMKPIEYDYYYSCLAENRRAELDLERDIILDGKTYHQLGMTVTTKQWEDWLSEKSIAEDLEFLQDFHPELIPDSTTVTERREAFCTSFSQWLDARRAIAAALPKAQGESYDHLTADIHCRIVGTLEWLVTTINND